MKKILRVYARMLKVHWAILLEYRGDTFFYMFGSFIYPMVTLAVWMAIAANKSIGSYSHRDFILYFLVVTFVTRMNSAWDPWEIETLIREGGLSSFLLRPSAFFHWRFSENLVYKFFYGAIMLIAWAIAWPFTDVVHISLHPAFLAVCLLSVVLAMVMKYMLGFDTALLGFWTTRMLAIANLVESFGLFLSGRIAPFALLPAWVRQSQDYTPFYWTLGFPVDLITGKVTGQAVWNGLAMQALWTAIFIALYFGLWHRGVRKYSAVGG